MRILVSFQCSGFSFQRGVKGAPLPMRAGFGGHAELGPCGATAFAAFAGAAQRGGIPLGTGAAGGFAGGEDFGRGERKSACTKTPCRLSGGADLL